LKHYATSDFWAAYRSLPAEARELADKNFELLKADPQHPSLHFKVVGRFRSVRVGLRYRALGIELPDENHLVLDWDARVMRSAPRIELHVSNLLGVRLLRADENFRSGAHAVDKGN
jgi:hypothetical protein